MGNIWKTIKTKVKMRWHRLKNLSTPDNVALIMLIILAIFLTLIMYSDRFNVTKSSSDSLIKSSTRFGVQSIVLVSLSIAQLLSEDR